MNNKIEKNTEISDRISQVIELLSVNPNIFSKKLGYARTQTIYDILNSKSAPSFDFFNRLFSSEYSALINPVWLFTGQGLISPNSDGELSINMKEKFINDHEENPHLYKRVPLIPANAVAGFSNGDVQVNDYDVLDHYVIPEFSNKGVKYLIRASGSSMYPKYSNGDLLACRPITDSSFLQWGKVYVLDTDQGPLVKRLFQCRQNDDAIECHSDNKEHYPPFVLPKTSIRKISIVVGVIRLE